MSSVSTQEDTALLRTRSINSLEANVKLFPPIHGSNFKDSHRSDDQYTQPRSGDRQVPPGPDRLVYYSRDVEGDKFRLEESA